MKGRQWPTPGSTPTYTFVGPALRHGHWIVIKEIVYTPRGRPPIAFRPNSSITFKNANKETVQGFVALPLKSATRQSHNNCVLAYDPKSHKCETIAIPAIHSVDSRSITKEQQQEMEGAIEKFDVFEPADDELAASLITNSAADATWNAGQRTRSQQAQQQQEKVDALSRSDIEQIVQSAISAAASYKDKGKKKRTRSRKGGNNDVDEREGPPFKRTGQQGRQQQSQPQQPQLPPIIINMPAPANSGFVHERSLVAFVHVFSWSCDFISCCV